MAYNNAIPTAAQRLKDSQPELLENFATISALLGVDHVISPWTDPATGDQGKHKKVTMPEQGGDQTTAANEMSLYTKVGATSGVSELFLRRESNGTVLNLTETNLGATGYAYLPGGLLVKWGIQAVGAVAQPGEITVTYNGAHPAFASAVYGVMLTPQASAGTTADNANHHVTVKTYTGLASFVFTHRKVEGSSAYPNAWNVFYVAYGV